MSSVAKNITSQNVIALQDLHHLQAQCTNSSHQFRNLSADPQTLAKGIMEELKTQEEELAAIPQWSQITQRYIENSHSYLFFFQREKWIEAHNKLQLWSLLPGGPEYLEDRLQPGSEEQVALEFESWIQSKPDLLNLRVLRLSKRHLTRIPSEIKLLTQLEVLEISQIPLRVLPPEIGALTQLRQLSLHHTLVRFLPSELRHLNRLQHVGLWNNQLENIDPLGSLSNLTKLSASANKISRLPLHIYWSRLESFDLSNNQLRELPDNFYLSTSLRSVILHDNYIHSLSERITHLTQLKTLCLNSNGLSSLPPGLANLSQLVSLNLEHNRLSLLPAELSTMTSLQELTLKNNFFSSRPLFLPQEVWTDI